MIDKSSPTCHACPLSSAKLVPPFGTGAYPLLILHDAPLGADAIERKPLSHRTPGGALFQQLLRGVSLSPEQVWIWNLVNCVPPTPTLSDFPLHPTALSQCSSHLRSFIHQFRPRAILAMGPDAIRVTTGLAGKKQTPRELNAYIIDSLFGPPVVATFSPADLRTDLSSAFREAFLVALKKALTLAQGASIQRPDLSTSKVFCTPSDLFSFASSLSPSDPIYYDIETPYSSTESEEDLRASEETLDADPLLSDSSIPSSSPTEPSTPTITQIQFAGPTLNQAFVANWSLEIAEACRTIFSLPNTFYGWNNRNFDNPILLSSLNLSRFSYVDLMNFWHRFRPDLPMSLAFATPWFLPHAPTWKHLHAADPGLYGVLDVVSLQHIHKGLLAYTPTLIHPTTRISLHQSFHTQDIPFTTALDGMQRRGYPVDKERLTSFDTELATQIQTLRETMHPLMPPECLGTTKDFYRTHPTKLRKGFSPEDLVLEKRLVPEEKTVAVLRTTKALAGKTPPPEIEAAVGNPWDSLSDLPGRDKWLKAHTLLTGHEVEQEVWVYKRPFNPGSRDQILSYLEFKVAEEVKEFGAKDSSWNGTKDPRGYKTNHLWEVPKDPNDPQKDWVGGKGLARLQAKLTAAGKPDPFLAHLIDYIKISKMRSAFTKTWIPTDANLIHTTYKQNPATGQLAAVKPNLLQCFSGDTEVLTPSGWQRFDVYEEGTPVAQYHLDGSIDFVVPEGYVRQERADVINIVTEKQIDLCVTADHRCLVRNRRNGATKVVQAKDFPFDMHQICAGHYSGGVKTFRETQLIIIAALQADGNVSFPARAIRPVLNFRFSRTRKIERLKAALEAESIPYRMAPAKQKAPHHAPMVSITINSSAVPEWLSPSYKYFGPWVLELSKDSFQFLANEIFHWDGSHNRRAFNSKYEQNVNWAQILQVLSGRRAIAKPYIADARTGQTYWRIDVCDRPYANTANHAIIPEPPQTVYCVSVPSTFIVVRRNGRVAMSGQCPKHGTVAKKWKHVIRAHKGKRWINFDFSGFHALTTGFEANDPSYIRAARIDIHGILGYIREKLPDYQRLVEGLRDSKLMSDEEIADRVKKWARKEAPTIHGRTFKERRDKVYKTTVLGVQFGMRPRKMFNLNPDVFLSQTLAQEVWETERGLWPKIFEYQDAQRDKAARAPHYLISRYGFVRFFFNVFDYTPDKVTREMRKSPGKDSEAAVAFEPANDAFGHVRDTIIYLDRTICPTTGLSLAEKFGLVNNVHDSLEFHCPSCYVEECIDIVGRLMQRRNLILAGPAAPEGLWCGAECEVGLENEGMDTYQDVAIPSGPFDFDIRGVVGWPTLNP